VIIHISEWNVADKIKKKIFDSYKNWFIGFLEVFDYEFAIRSEKFCDSKK